MLFGLQTSHIEMASESYKSNIGLKQNNIPYVIAETNRASYISYRYPFLEVLTFGVNVINVRYLAFPDVHKYNVIKCDVKIRDPAYHSG